jgi:hypothetical protein
MMNNFDRKTTHDILLVGCVCARYTLIFLERFRSGFDSFHGSICIALSDHNYDNLAEYNADISSNDQPVFICSLAWTAMIWIPLTPLSTLPATRSLHVPNNANV